ncbi:cell division protein FtsB [Ilumatobacter fluminis]|uniref:Cell division protein FtsB n=1 Tax=Ilumatobacter fluminis TaxID=467091 RepID=A0A4R7HWS9_9ACTN|nr:septum formation initiator family protein [Ilumatobacter fluminis]TDT15577.1 cell division protein FtsB [Ilumatobacter fluminis]
MPDQRTTLDKPARPAADAGRSRLGDVTRPVVRDRRVLVGPRSSTVLLALVALGIAGALAYALFGIPFRTLFEQDERIAERTEQVDELEAVVADLRSEVDRLNTEDGIREAAREELGYVETGEIRESILDYPDLPTDLPNGWPYSVVNEITTVRRGGLPAPSGAVAPAPTTVAPTDDG